MIFYFAIGITIMVIVGLGVYGLVTAIISHYEKGEKETKGNDEPKMENESAVDVQIVEEKEEVFVCEYCGTKVDDKHSKCPSCGAQNRK